MMASFNKVILAGNLTRDPELKYTPKGTAITRIGLAIKRTWADESGQKKEEVSFIDIEAWGKQGEVIAQYMRKGRPLLVEGRLKMDSWDDKATGRKMSKLKVVLESFSFIDSKRAENDSPPPGPKSATPAPASEPIAGDGPPEGDDVPF